MCVGGGGGGGVSAKYPVPKGALVLGGILK